LECWCLVNNPTFQAKYDNIFRWIHITLQILRLGHHPSKMTQNREN
jgi:hypothetical protein